ncbi:hypothetical protein CCH79_00019358 [Gambusia affinis]|uniref:Neural proliferation differentiation and control protein 1 n=1 Tax=Gambusia affinis TaxID=33528 RepID=A0A315UWN7_GAMAF|nr:hypothetical protein CCH79_00019358 [Gambusia affinis]
MTATSLHSAETLNEEYRISTECFRIQVRSQLRWLGHLVRMPPGRLSGEVFWARPTGRRPRGRPRTRWRDYVSRLAWERLGIPPEELEEVAGEREASQREGGKEQVGSRQSIGSSEVSFSDRNELWAGAGRQVRFGATGGITGVVFDLYLGMRDRTSKVRAYPELDQEIDILSGIISEQRSESRIPAPPSQDRKAEQLIRPISRHRGSPTDQPTNLSITLSTTSAPSTTNCSPGQLGEPRITTYPPNDQVFLIMTSVIITVCLLVLVISGICCVRIVRDAYLEAQKLDYPACETQNFGNFPGDQKLAHSAQMYHYQHQKQQMLSLQQRRDELRPPDTGTSTDEENDGDFTVYECPGLAPIYLPYNHQSMGAFYTSQQQHLSVSRPDATRWPPLHCASSGRQLFRSRGLSSRFECSFLESPSDSLPPGSNLCPRSLDCARAGRFFCRQGSSHCGPCLYPLVEDHHGRCVAMRRHLHHSAQAAKGRIPSSDHLLLGNAIGHRGHLRPQTPQFCRASVSASRPQLQRRTRRAKIEDRRRKRRRRMEKRRKILRSFVGLVHHSIPWRLREERTSVELKKQEQIGADPLDTSAAATELG